jgi:hypothetical protein
MNLTLFPAVMLAQIGCAEPGSIAGIEEACQGQDILDAFGVAELLAQLDPDCAEALSGPVGLESSMDPSTPQGWLVAGLFVLWDERGTRLRDDYEHPDLPELARDQLGQAILTQDLDPEGPVGEGWYAYVLESVQHTEVEELGGVLARMGRNELLINEELPGLFIEYELQHPVGMAMLWVHEASHLPSRHQRCTGDWSAGPICDASQEGAHGVSAFYLRRWMSRNPDPRVDCKEVVAFSGCRLISEPSEDWPICEELAQRCR